MNRDIMDKSDLAHYVAFRMGPQIYALPLRQVERTVRMVAVSHVPDSPPWLLGVLDLQGRIIPVVSIRQRFNHPARDPHPDDHLLIVTAHGHHAAIVVEQVTEVLKIPAAAVKCPEEIMESTANLAGIISKEDGLILILDAEHLLGFLKTSAPPNVFREAGLNCETA